MALSESKKRKLANPTSKPSKKFHKQTHYSSPSSSASGDEFPAIDLTASDSEAPTDPEANPPSQPQNPALTLHPHSPNETTSASSASSDTSTQSPPTNPNTTKVTQRSKRNDPSTFATAITTILSSKLSTSNRADPVLSRSHSAQLASTSLQNAKLESKARHQIREDRKTALDRGHVRDVLLGTDAPNSAALSGVSGREGEGEGGSVGELQEQEKRLRKTAQRGVVKLFNAVRMAQVRGEEATRKGGSRGRVEERVGEMSKRGFLEMVAAGGEGRGGGGGIEEA